MNYSLIVKLKRIDNKKTDTSGYIIYGRGVVTDKEIKENRLNYILETIGRDIADIYKKSNKNKIKK